MLNFIPVIGWLLSFVFAFCIAIPFTILWNWLAPIYAYWLPELYQQLPFFHVVGLFMLMPMVKFLISPVRISTTSTSNNK